jgi:hypothetical protein
MTATEIARMLFGSKGRQQYVIRLCLVCFGKAGSTGMGTADQAIPTNITPWEPEAARGPNGEKRPADFIGNAVKVMRIATGEEADDIPNDGKEVTAGHLE